MGDTMFRVKKAFSAFAKDKYGNPFAIDRHVLFVESRKHIEVCDSRPRWFMSRRRVNINFYTGHSVYVSREIRTILAVPFAMRFAFVLFLQVLSISWRWSRWCDR